MSSKRSLFATVLTAAMSSGTSAQSVSGPVEPQTQIQAPAPQAKPKELEAPDVTNPTKPWCWMKSAGD